MGTGGRVVHHLRNMLPKAKHSVILVGYQAVGTRGRNLVEGATEVKMHGEMVPVRAEIESIQSFSVHADGDELIAWMSTVSEAPNQVLVVHGEAGVAETFSDRIKSQLGWKSHAPHDGEIVRL
jgi:metallo-beta-lactamase family protein